MILAGADRLSSPPRAEIHRSGRARHLVVAHTARIAITQTAIAAQPPTTHAPHVEHRADVKVTRTDRLRSAPGTQIDRPDRARRLVIANAARIAIAQLTISAKTPTTHPPARQQPTTVMTTHIKPTRHRRQRGRSRLGPHAPGESDLDSGHQEQRTQRDSRPWRYAARATNSTCLLSPHLARIGSARRAA